MRVSARPSALYFRSPVLSVFAWLVGGQAAIKGPPSNVLGVKPHIQIVTVRTISTPDVQDEYSAFIPQASFMGIEQVCEYGSRNEDRGTVHGHDHHLYRCATACRCPRKRYIRPPHHDLRLRGQFTARHAYTGGPRGLDARLDLPTRGLLLRHAVRRQDKNDENQDNQVPFHNFALRALTIVTFVSFVAKNVFVAFTSRVSARTPS